jgi:hypothetical protein
MASYNALCKSVPKILVKNVKIRVLGIYICEDSNKVDLKNQEQIELNWLKQEPVAVPYEQIMLNNSVLHKTQGVSSARFCFIALIINYAGFSHPELLKGLTKYAVVTSQCLHFTSIFPIWGMTAANLTVIESSNKRQWRREEYMLDLTYPWWPARHSHNELLRYLIHLNLSVILSLRVYSVRFNNTEATLFNGFNVFSPLYEIIT